MDTLRPLHLLFYYLKEDLQGRECQGDSILELVSLRGGRRHLESEYLLSHLLVQKYLPSNGKFEFTHQSGPSDLCFGSINSSTHTAEPSFKWITFCAYFQNHTQIPSHFKQGNPQIVL